jgi:hypothetical protein
VENPKSPRRIYGYRRFLIAHRLAREPEHL